ncbi:MAG: hypothetical protein ACP5JF_07815 [Candidatus Methanodesulfokora sp.]
MILLLPLPLVSLFLMQRAWHHLSFYRPVFRAHYAATTSALLLVFLSLFLIFIALVVYGQVKETREALEKFSYISNLIAISSILLGISALILISTVSHGIYKLGDYLKDSLLSVISLVLLVLSIPSLLIFLSATSAFSLEFLFLTGISPWLAFILVPFVLTFALICLIALFIELGRLRSKASVISVIGKIAEI